MQADRHSGGMAGAPCATLALRPTAEAVRGAVTALEARLVARGAAVAAAGLVALAVAEALNNIVEHAGVPDTDDGIRLRCRWDGRCARILLLDRGGPMRDGAAPAGHPPDLGTMRAALPEGGFGWFLIRHLGREVRYARRAGRNRLQVVLPLEPEAGMRALPGRVAAH